MIVVIVTVAVDGCTAIRGIWFHRVPADMHVDVAVGSTEVTAAEDVTVNSAADNVDEGSREGRHFSI